MTDKELRDAAWVELTKTTDTYPKWKSRGFPPATGWGRAKSFLDQIGLAAPSPPPPSSIEPAPIAGQGYRKVFEDDFNTLDTNVWSKNIWYLPEAPAANIYVQDSILNLVTKRAENWIAAHVTTSKAAGNTRSFRRGYFEARLKYSPDVGAWPAFWLFNTNWRTNASCPPYVSELDIFEAFPLAANSRQHSGTLHRNTAHPGPCSDVPDTMNPNSWTADTGVNQTADFHVYAALWTTSEVIWYLDGRELKRCPTFDTTDQDMFLILNIDAQRGDFGVPAPPAGVNELRTQVDWVRVWQK